MSSALGEKELNIPIPSGEDDMRQYLREIRSFPRLSKQAERDLARRCAEGDEDAAEMLGCTKANIRWHIGKILDKTGYRTRMELLIAVAQKNLIIVSPDKALDEDNY